MSYILVCGNPLDGYSFTGPFDSWADAYDWAKGLTYDHCSIAGLTPPGGHA